jgi:hypothetical protein
MVWGRKPGEYLAKTDQPPAGFGIRGIHKKVCFQFLFAGLLFKELRGGSGGRILRGRCGLLLTWGVAARGCRMCTATGMAAMGGKRRCAVSFTGVHKQGKSEQKRDGKPFHKGGHPARIRRG